MAAINLLLPILTNMGVAEYRRNIGVDFSCNTPLCFVIFLIVVLSDLGIKNEKFVGVLKPAPS